MRARCHPSRPRQTEPPAAPLWRGRRSAGYLLLDVLAGCAVLVVAFGAVGLFAVRERQLVDDLRRRAAVDALLTEQIERLRATPFSALRVGLEQRVPLDGLDRRLVNDVTCSLDIEPFRPESPDLLRVTVRVVWQGPYPSEVPPVVRERTTLIARRDYEEGR